MKYKVIVKYARTGWETIGIYDRITTANYKNAQYSNCGLEHTIVYCDDNGKELPNWVEQMVQAALKKAGMKPVKN